MMKTLKLKSYVTLTEMSMLKTHSWMGMKIFKVRNNEYHSQEMNTPVGI
jgi:hypothetical protein